MRSNEASAVARWGSLNVTAKAGCLLLEGWPSRKHAFQLFILQPLSEQRGGTGRQEWREARKDFALHLKLGILSFAAKADSEMEVQGMAQRRLFIFFAQTVALCLLTRLTPGAPRGFLFERGSPSA